MLAVRPCTWLALASLCAIVRGSSSCTNNMKVMTQYEGVIEFNGWQSSPQDCLWHVLPGNGVRTILFNTTGTILYGTDTVAFFASPKAATPLKEYGSGTDKEIPEYLRLKDGKQVLISLRSTASNTTLKISYKCLIDERLFYSLQVSPLWLALWMGVWLLLIAMCCASTCWIVRYRRREQRRAARNAQLTSTGDRSAPRSILMMHADLLRRREQERRDDREATEQNIMGALRALPTRAWQGITAGGTGRDGGCGNDGNTSVASSDIASSAAISNASAADAAECCLCMEAFALEDQVRLLPCDHYFHRDCIDKWFESRAYQQRSCPLCKRDPLSAPNMSPSNCTSSVIAQSVTAEMVEEGTVVGSVAMDPSAEDQVPEPSAGNDGPEGTDVVTLGHAQLPASQV